MSDPKPLPGVLSMAQRVEHGRCRWCEWHPPTQGHDVRCPRPRYDDGDWEIEPVEVVNDTGDVIEIDFG